MIHILNHYTRDPSYTLNQIEAQGYKARVSTDRTNFSKKRDWNRYRGLNQNHLGCIISPDDDEWRIVCHDDVEISDGALDKIYHILQYAPHTLVSFFNNPHSNYDKALEQGKHVVTTYESIWYQFVAFHKSFGKPLEEWIDKHIALEDFGAISEDSIYASYLSLNEIPAYVVTPALIQHQGYDRSTFKNNAKVGKRYRYAYHYDPDFDVYSVDWEQEFANPYPALQKWVTKKIQLRDM